MFIDTETIANMMAETPMGQKRVDADTLAEGKHYTEELLDKADKLRDTLADALETFNDPDTTHERLFRTCCTILNLLESPEWNNVRGTNTMAIPSCKTWDHMEEKHWQRIEEAHEELRRIRQRAHRRSLEVHGGDS